MKEIRVHGRGGQGVVLASAILVNALIKDGKYAACFPFFGFERRGAPVVGFIRFDERPIRRKDQVYTPDCVVVMDSSLFKAVNVYQGIKDPGTLVLNGSRPIDAFDFPAEVRRVGAVDATRISLETINTFIPNIAMLGALCRTTGWTDFHSLIKGVRESLSPKIRQKNLEMLERAYEETRLFERDEEGRWR